MKITQKTYQKQVFVSLAFIALLIVIAGCGSSKNAWKKVQDANSLEAYEEYLRDNPSADNTDFVRSKIDTLSFLRVK